MDSEPHPHHKRRETVLTVALVIILGGLFLFFLNLISLGIFMYVGAVVIAMGLVGFLHYVLWGQTLTEDTAGEREEEELKARLDIDRDDWERRD
jgi:hypothetical protein